MSTALLTAKDVAEELRVSLRHVWRMNNSGKLPRPVRIGRSVRWSRSTIIAWIAAGCPDRADWEAMTAAMDKN